MTSQASTSWRPPRATVEPRPSSPSLDIRLVIDDKGARRLLRAHSEPPSPLGAHERARCIAGRRPAASEKSRRPRCPCANRPLSRFTRLPVPGPRRLGLNGPSARSHVPCLRKRSRAGSPRSSERGPLLLPAGRAKPFGNVFLRTQDRVGLPPATGNSQGHRAHNVIVVYPARYGYKSKWRAERGPRESCVRAA